MRYFPFVHACLLTSAAQLVAAAAIPTPPDTVVPSGTVDDAYAANTDCIAGMTCGNDAILPDGGSLETVSTDAQGNPVTVPPTANNPATPRPTADEASLSITVINGNTPVIADPVPPTPPADVVGGNADTSDCDAQVSTPIPSNPVAGVPAADQVYTVTDVRGTVFTVPAWIPQPTADKTYTVTDVRGNVFTVPAWLPQPTEDHTTKYSQTGVVSAGGLPGFADPIPSKEECDGYTEIAPVVTRPPGGTVSSIVSITRTNSFLYTEPAAMPTTDAAGNIIGTPNDSPPSVEPISGLPSKDSGANDPVTPHKIHGDGHIMTPITPVDIATPVPANGNVPVFVDPVPPAPPNDPEPTRVATIYGDGHLMNGPKQPTKEQVVRVKRQDDETQSESDTSTRKACGAHICGGPECPAGTAEWVTVAPVNCLKIPISTAAPAAATPRKDSLVQTPPKADHPTSPLLDYPKMSKELDDYMVGVLIKLNTQRKWYIHASNEVSGKWYGFQDFKTAAGMARLHGCTAVFIVSKQGVYVSHIYEMPMFVREPSPGQFVSAPDEFFRKNTFEALVHGEQSEFLQPMEGLVGTKEQPGPLHFTNQPKIFIVTPSANLEDRNGPIMYPEKVAMLSDLLHGYLYPSGSEQYSQEPMTLPYKIPTQVMSEDPRNTDGKATMEASKLVRYDRVGDELIPVGRWRLWVNRIEAATWEFWGTVQKPIGLLATTTDEQSYAGVCPVSMPPDPTTNSPTPSDEVSCESHPTRPD